jgi:predicted ATPase
MTPAEAMPEIAPGSPSSHGAGAVVVLTGPPGAGKATTLRRAADRGDPALTDAEPIRSLHHQFTDIGEFGRHVLDSTQLGPQATTDAVRRGLAEGTYLLP